MWLLPSYFQCLCRAALIAATLCAALPAQAQQPQDLPAQSDTEQTAPAQNAPTAKPPKPYGGGSPLDVIIHTKLWETPPEPKPFVKESREPSDTLDYQPTVGTDPKRPKLLSKGQLKDLESELEQAGAHNEKAAGVKDANFADVELGKTAKRKAHKGKAEMSKDDMRMRLHR